MPKRNPKKQNSELDNLLGGRDASGKFIKRTAQIDKMRDVIQKLNKEQSKFKKLFDNATKSMKRSLKTEKVLLSSKVRMQNQMEKMNRQLRKQRRETEKGTKVNRNFSLSFLKIAAASSLAFLAFRKAQNLANQRISTAVLGGPDIGQRVSRNLPAGLSSSAALDAINKTLQQSLKLRFDVTDSQLKALSQITKSTVALGAGRSGDLTSAFIGSLEQAEVPQFLESVLTDGVRRAIDEFANLQNIEAASFLRNAVDTQTASKEGKLDPLTESAIKIAQTVDILNEKFEQIIVKLADGLLPSLDRVTKIIDALSPNELLIGAGAVVAAPFVAGAVGGIVAKGLLKGGLAAGAGVAGLATVGIGSAVLAADQFNRFAKGEGTIGGSITDKVFGFDEKSSEINRKGDAELLQALGMTTREFAKKQKQLQVENQQRDASRLQDRKVTGIQPANIDALDARAKAETKIVGGILAHENALDAANKELESFSRKTKNVAKPAGDNISRLQTLTLERNQTTLDAQESATITALRRASQDFASQTAFGPVLALDQIRETNSALRDQITIAEKMLKLTDDSTQKGRIDSNLIRTSIVDLKTQERVNTRTLRTAFLDSAVSDVFGSSGAFEKIIIDQNRNLVRGLQNKVINDVPMEFVGEFGKPTKGLSGRKITDLLPQIDNPFQTINNLSRSPIPAITATPIKINQSSNNAAELLRESARGHDQQAKVLRKAANVMAQDMSSNIGTFNDLTTSGSNRLGSNL